MPTKYYTLEEANALLPKIKPLVEQLVQRRAKVSRLSLEMGGQLMDLHSNVGGTLPSQLAQDFVAIETLVHRIQAHGCVVKDIHTGLLDFLSLRNGREVYLCWRYGEPQIAFFHELHTGFNGRQPL